MRCDFFEQRICENFLLTEDYHDRFPSSRRGAP